MERLSIRFFLVFEGIWSIRITLVQQAISTLLDPSFPIIFICFLRPLFCRVLGVFSLATLSPLFLIPLPKLTVYQKPFFIYPPRFPPLSFLLSRASEYVPGCYSVTLPPRFYPPGSSHLFPVSLLPLFAERFLLHVYPFFSVLFFISSNLPDLAHLHYFVIETIFPPKHVVPTV